MANAVVYCRVSTDDQEKEGTSLQTQLDACLKYCHDKCYTVLNHFSETYTGTTLDRPQLTALRDMINAGEADVVVIYCLDRLTRNPAHGAILTQEFERISARLEAATEVIENTPTGNLISYIRGYASQMEVDKIRERTTRGKAARLKQGFLPTGTGTGPFGYYWNKTTKRRVIIDSEAETVRQMFSMAINGKSMSHIAQALNTDHIKTKPGGKWSNITVRRLISNPIYCGDTYYGRHKKVSKNKTRTVDKDEWILLPDVTPAILDRQTFDAAQLAIKTKYPQAPKPHSNFFLTGHISCPKCKAPICGATLRGKYRYYRCRGTTASSTREAICNAPYIQADQIEAYVWERVVSLTQSTSTILFTLLDKHYDSTTGNPVDLIPTIDKQISALHTKLKTYPAREQALMELYTEPNNVTKELVLLEIDKVKELQQKDRDDIDKLLETRKKAAAATKITLKLSEYSERLKAALPDKLTPAAKREFLDLYFVRVFAHKDKWLVACYADNVVFSEDRLFDQEFDAAFTQALKEAEAQYPDMTLLEIIDYSKRLPAGHPFCQLINELKSGARKPARIKLASIAHDSAQTEPFSGG